VTTFCIELEKTYSRFSTATKSAKKFVFIVFSLKIITMIIVFHNKDGLLH